LFRRALAYAPAFVVVFGVFLGSASAGKERHAALILDANTGAVLHQKDGDTPRHPASLTKMMTLYMTFETLESGRLKMSDRLTISQAAASVAPSKLDLKPGATISVSDAVMALITKSANDIAVALAEKIGGTEANFVRLMNARAREIGMAKTNFENASGLPNPDQVTTARDMATLALRLQDDFPKYYPLFATQNFKYGGKSYRNHNTMLKSFSGIDGIKTGYTRASGFNLVTSWRRGNQHLIGVVFGGNTAAERNTEMRVLLTRMASRASSVKTRKPTQLVKAKGEQKSAERPAARPKPLQVAETKAVATPRQASAPEPAKNSAADPETPVRIFKVRPVPIMTKAAAPASPDETTDMEATNGAPDSAPDRAPPPSLSMPSKWDRARLAEISAEHVAPAEEAASDDVVIRPFAPANLGASDGTGSSPYAVPSPGLQQVAFSSPDVTASSTADDTRELRAPAKLNSIASTDASHPAPVVRGTPPSTLGAQAAALHLTSTHSPSVAAPAKTSKQRKPSGRYAVQIGAYVSINDAQRALTNVQGRAGQLLAGVPTVTNPAMKDGRQVYRARFTGFDANRATSTCDALRKQSVDCFVMASD